MKFIVYKRPNVRCQVRNGLLLTTVMGRHLEGKFYERRLGLPERRFVERMIGLIHIHYDHSSAVEHRWKAAARRMDHHMYPRFDWQTENF